MSSVPGWAGRYIVLKDSTGNAVAGLSSKSFTIEREGIDVTTDDEEGFQAMLGEPGRVALNISAEGVVRTGNLSLIESALNPDTSLESYVLEFPWGATATGDYFLGNFEITGETAEAITFSADLQSSGIITYDTSGVS